MKNFSLITLLLAFITIVPQCAVSYTIDGKEVDIFEVLSIFEDMKGAARVSQIALILQSRGLNLREFSDEVLSDLAYLDYWNNAQYFLAAHYKDNLGELAKEMLSLLKRDEKHMVDGARAVKIGSLNILGGILGPNSFENPELKHIILNDLDTMFQNSNILTSEYWAKEFQVEDLWNLPKESLTYEQSNSRGQAATAARMCVQIAARLYFLTQESKYKAALEKYSASGGIFYISKEFEDAWLSGRLDLFAYLNPPKRNGPPRESIAEKVREVVRQRHQNDQN
ncbi:MAG: hypothetical protein C4527_26440 [Candidatus Omnitrophota bacterium]|jgi:hypothetical protein|nr:MAG: hypothetical protein C4527_26440 [Candidatus Omnitrophota bacterium]